MDKEVVMLTRPKPTIIEKVDSLDEGSKPILEVCIVLLYILALGWARYSGYW